MRPSTGSIAVYIFLLILTLRAAPWSDASLPPSANRTYWNVDGDFSFASQHPYYAHNYSVQVHNLPWGNMSWNTSGFSIYINRTKAPVDEYLINVTSGIAHAWVREDSRLVDARTGVTGFGEDNTGGYQPLTISMLGRDTILAYKIMRENTGISQSLTSPDSDGILFDLFAQSQYPVNGSAYTSFMVIDFYVHQECGPLNGLCANTNDTTLTKGLANNHIIIGHTHFFEWRIHNNLDEKVWVSDVVNLRWYLEQSQRMAYCHDTTGSDNCSSPVPQGYLTGLTATAETFGGTSGFALNYEYLLQANDCGTGQNAGSDFNHSLLIQNLHPGPRLEVDGWLGSGSLYKDQDDYYQFNVTRNLLLASHSLFLNSTGEVSTQLYAAGSPPTSRQLTLGVYKFGPSDPTGLWYVRVSRHAGFGPYSIFLTITPSTALDSPVSTPAICTEGSPLQPPTTPWLLVAGVTGLALLIIGVGRRRSRR